MLDAANRSLTIARALAEASREGVQPPESLVNPYLARVDGDDAELRALREKVSQFKSLFRTH